MLFLRFFNLVFQLAALCLYAYTIYLAYTLSGIIAAFLSAIFPVLSNCYWIYDRWSVTGDILNFYTQLNLIVLAMFIVFIACHFVFDRDKNHDT